MKAQEIMDLSLQLAGIAEVPDDSGIIVEPEAEVEKVMFGVDVDTSELLLARELGVDMVIAHHPGTGEPSLGMYRVMRRQIDRMVNAGVPIARAQKALAKRQGVIERGSHPRNYDRVASAARLLGMPLMNIHMPLDIITENLLQAHLDRKLDERSTVGDVLSALLELPEYAAALAGPEVRAGGRDDYAGRVYCIVAGGTNGGADVARAYYDAGVGTLVAMHVPEDVLTAVKEQNYGNFVVAGHMASDSVGINALIRELESRGVQVIAMGGIITP